MDVYKEIFQLSPVEDCFWGELNLRYIFGASLCTKKNCPVWQIYLKPNCFLELFCKKFPSSFQSIENSSYL